MLGIPVEQYAITTAIGRLMSDAAILSLNPRYPWSFMVQVVHDRYPTEYARNWIAKHFLESKAEYLWFIDSDTLPSENSFALMKIAQDADVTCGIYPIYRGEREANNLSLDWSFYNQTDTGEKPRWQPLCLEEMAPGAVIRCDAAATGCMLIHRRVLEHYATQTERDCDGTPAIFRWPKYASGKSVASDDLDFCGRLKADGFSLQVHTGVRWGHLKQRNLADWYAQIKGAFMSGVEEQRLVQAGVHPGVEGSAA